LDDLVTAIPDKLWLTAVRKRGKDGNQGMALDNPTIAKFMTNLEKSGVVKNVELVVSSRWRRKSLA